MIRHSMEGANCRAVSAAMEPSGLCETQVPASRGHEDGEVGCEGVRCTPADGVRGGRFARSGGGGFETRCGGRWCEGGEAGEDGRYGTSVQSASSHIRAFRRRSTPPWPRCWCRREKQAPVEVLHRTGTHRQALGLHLHFEVGLHPRLRFGAQHGLQLRGEVPEHGLAF